MSRPDDDLDGLRSALRAAAPRPDPATRAAHLALARENFDRLQAAGAPARPISRRPSVWRGARDMLTTLTTRGGLTATTALVACGLLLVTPAGQDLWRRAPVPAEPGPSATVEPAAADGTERAEPYAAGQAAEVASPAILPDDPFLAQPAAEDEAPEPTEEDAAAESAGMTVPAQSVIPPEPLPEPIAPVWVLPADEAEAADEAEPDGFAFDAAPHAGQAEAPPALAGPLARAAAEPAFAPPPLLNTEAYANADDNPVRIAAEEPVSTFSIDVDTASYAVVRRSLTGGELPPPEAVRVEEMVNAFPYAFPAPAPGEGPVRPTTIVQPTPWNPGTRLVTIALQGERVAPEGRPPLDLVFLIDTSGSMEDPAKLPLLRQSFRLMLGAMRPEDRVAIVTYAGSSGLALPPTPASDRGAVLAALDGLAAGGPTNGEGGLRLAYGTVEAMTAPGRVARVILATDGDFNLGLDDPAALERFIAERRAGGAYLSVLGFGRGDLDDATMQALAQAGNGQAAYIDTLQEAQRVLADQIGGALVPIAGDVKVQVEWNPAEVAEYRLIGYETRGLRREAFSDDGADAGDMGAGHAVVALYEVTPVGSPARLSDPLRYAAGAAPNRAPGELGLLRLRWKDPGEEESRLLEVPIRLDAAVPPEVASEARFAAAIAGWGQLLRGSVRLGGWGLGDAVALAVASRGADPSGARAEAVGLMRLSEGLSE